MSVSPQLPGTDLAQFIRDGHLVVKTSLPDSFHRDLHAKIEDVFEKEGNPGNNILPRVPEIASVYDDPAVRSALQSLLGPGYIMNPHRHCHLNPPG
ncbi:MAG: phytanoyl-CoA dioxygenase, partial [Gemmatimonadetes bacterium]|nr:phytanoyl-CoA dioxygenase [Gemmatimonadota bacterium]